ncbi:MAG: hypothetical protein NC131_09120 [Roseburia sp.]|nr:hypothetical protein [Roseburia sp.]
MELKVQTFQSDERYFIAGADIAITTATKTAGAAIAAHTPVIIDAAGKVSPAADKTKLTGIYGISADSAEKDQDAVIYLTGEFFGDELVLADGITAADVEVPLRNIGIFLK